MSSRTLLSSDATGGTLPPSRAAVYKQPQVLPNLGYGIGLRPCHYQEVLRHRPGQTIDGVRAPDWLEVISENAMDDHGHTRHILHRIAEHYPLVFHGVSLSIGSSDPLQTAYLQRLKKLCDEFSPAWISDHLCWTGVGGINSHDLLPLPLTAANLRHVISRVHQVQEQLGRRLILENPSSYMRFKSSDIPEWEFFNALCSATGAGILLDLNNVYVSAFNLGFKAHHYLDNLQLHHIAQVHLAGPRHLGTHIIDTHESPVVDAVWELYQKLIRKTGAISTLLEWDANIPAFPELMQELDKARHWQQQCLHVENSNPDHTATVAISI